MQRISLLVVAGLLFGELTAAYGQSCNRWNYNTACANTTLCCCVGIFFGSCCDDCHCAGTCTSQDPSIKRAFPSTKLKSSRK